MRMWIAISLGILLAGRSWAYLLNTGYSGAPGRGSCASTCHGSGTGTVTVSDFPTTYVPSQMYTITLSRSSGNAFNFNASCRVDTGTVNAGVLGPRTGSETYNVAGETNGVHFAAGGRLTGTFTWTAPPAGTGTVRLYVAAHQGSSTGPNTSIVLVSEELENPNYASATLVPLSVHLGPVYPNPFNPTTEISFELAKSERLRLAVFDVLGREVAVLEDGMLEAGSHAVVFDGSGLPSGVYFARMEAGTAVRTVKMMLLK